MQINNKRNTNKKNSASTLYADVVNLSNSGKMSNIGLKTRLNFK